MTIALAAGAPRWAPADVITIDDGGSPGPTSLPFTCTVGLEWWLWPPAMGFVYRDVERFELHPGDIIAFDTELRPTDPTDMGFLPQLDIALAHAPDPTAPFRPVALPGSDFTVVAHAAAAAGPGNRVPEDYDLAFTVDAPFSFPGGGLIIRVTHPVGPLASRTDAQCLDVITSDHQPTGVNRLVGTFRREGGEYPWSWESTAARADVPYVRIIWTRCGDGLTTGAEQCDDGNTINDDACSNACVAAVCGDGVQQTNEECDDDNTEDNDACSNQCVAAYCGDGRVQTMEECDNSAFAEADRDPYCDGECHLQAFAKGSGCDAGPSGGLVVALLVLGLLLSRRRAAPAILIAAAWLGPARAQGKTDGFRVDRFEMAPSVEDGLVIQDPTVLGPMAWSLSATLGFSNTLLRVVPDLASDEGIDVVGSRLSAYLDFAMGLGGRFEVNASLPFALAQATESGVAAGIMLREAARSSAVGDGRLGGSVLLYGRRAGPQLGLAASLALPLGSESSFTGDGGVGGELLATAGYVAPRYRVIANGGVRLRPEADYVTSDQGTEIIGRAGVIVPMARDRLHASLELDVVARTSGGDAYKELGSPILTLLGARYHFAGGIRAGAGVGVGLTEAPGSPLVRTLVTVGYSPEPRRRPSRPSVPPGPIDSDGDGVADGLDRCPDMPGDVNGVADGDGCPELDSDKDRIADGAPDPTGPLTLEQVITLPAPIEFYFDTAIMRPGAEVYLNQVLAVLKQHPEVTRLEIQGHTSSEGGAEYNLQLSNDRARAVFAWLVAHGIEASRLVPQGYGLTQPIAPNDSEPNRQRNRRVQFRLLEKRPGTPPVTPLEPAKRP